MAINNNLSPVFYLALCARSVSEKNYNLDSIKEKTISLIQHDRFLTNSKRRGICTPDYYALLPKFIVNPLINR